MGALLRGRRLIVGFAAALVVTGTGLALAHGSGTAKDSATTPSASPSDPSTSFTGPESFGFVPEHEWRKAQGLPPLTEADEVDFAAEGPITWIAESCRNEGPGPVVSTSLHCEAIIAVTEGRLAPGAYSDNELRAELRD